MSLTHNKFTLSDTTATLLTVPSHDEQEYASLLTISIQNLSSDRFVFLGDSSVTTGSYGYRIDPGQVFSADLNPNDDLYAVCDLNSTDVAVMWVQS